jgi:hypothetical protein
MTLVLIIIIILLSLIYGVVNYYPGKEKHHLLKIRKMIGK